MQINPVKISIVMSVYNGGKYLADSLESILNQTHRNLELIIVNDGSRDDSLEIIQNYMKVDKRIILIDQKNLGLTKSLNIAISVATGEYIARQDADDVSAPNRLKLFVNFLLKNKNIEIYSTPGILINENGRLIKTIPNYFRRNGSRWGGRKRIFK
jgi:glycosyltransferase involved in cell wall biosynthesis